VEVVGHRAQREGQDEEVEGVESPAGEASDQRVAAIGARIGRQGFRRTEFFDCADRPSM